MKMDLDGRSTRTRAAAWAFALALCLLALSAHAAAAGNAPQAKYRIFIVSSYHREYLWSQDTHKGVCTALLEHGFLDNEDQVAAFTRHDYVESSSAIIRKAWMDTKRKNSQAQIGATTNQLVSEIMQFEPDLILLGDDNAANYIGNQYIDTDVPVVFWGVNGRPLKYGLLESLEEPGHNVTGVYQAGYLKECLECLSRLVPDARTFAILSDDSPTGRSKAKELQQLSKDGVLPLKLEAIVITNSLSEWKARALELQDTVDAFFMLNHNSIKNDSGQTVDQMQIGAWYLRNVRKPECAHERQFAVEGMLCVCDDSGYNQGYEAVTLAHRILHNGEDPARITVKAPPRGPFIVNRERARMLGITISREAGIEAYIETAQALEEHSQRD